MMFPFIFRSSYLLVLDMKRGPCVSTRTGPLGSNSIVIEMTARSLLSVYSIAPDAVGGTGLEQRHLERRLHRLQGPLSPILSPGAPGALLLTIPSGDLFPREPVANGALLEQHTKVP